MRRNLFLLVSCQAIGQSANTMMFTATALSVVTFFPTRDLATQAPAKFAGVFAFK